jgi:predicted kinase
MWTAPQPPPTEREAAEEVPVSVAIILVGLPASGKSTIAADFVRKGWVEANLDNLRQALGLEQGAVTPELLTAHANVIGGALASGTPLVVSDTNINPTFRAALEQRIADAGFTPVVQVVDTPLEVCMARNAAREGFARVPDDVMHRMHAAFVAQF